MMKRTWGFHVLRCPTCARKMRVAGTITQPEVVKMILDHLHVRSTPLLPCAPARDPTWEQSDLGFDGFAAGAYRHARGTGGELPARGLPEYAPRGA